MATDWSSLGWTPTLNFALPNERQLAQSSIADAGKGAEFKFNPTSMNAQLLASLGYTGQGLGSSIPNEFGDTGPQWSDDARTWLANNGYTVGVAHEPGSAPNGRPEYYGLVDRNGQFVAGQDQPTMTMSDSLMEQITPFLMLAGPFASAISTMEGLAAAGGAAGASGGSAASGLSGAADGVTALGSQWSPQALGLTGGITPATSAAEIASLSSGIPGAVEVGAGLGAAGGASGLGGGGGGVTSLGPGMSPANLGITPVTPAVSGGEIAGLSQGIPGVVAPTASIGNTGGLSSADKSALYGNEGYGPGMSGAQTSAYDSILNATGSKGLADLAANSSIGGGLLDGIKGAADLVGGGQNLAGLVGAIGGAAGGSSGDQVSSRDPWAAAQPYLKNILADAERQRAALAAQPYTPQQTQQYQQAFAGLDQARSALPGLLNWGQSAMQRQNTVPSYQQLFGGGLLGQQQPTAQAGGAGGLLGNDDRIKALMARGQGLIG